MPNHRMTFSQDLLNHFVGSLIEGLDEIQGLHFDLRDGSFFLKIHGKRYVNYVLRAQFRVADVTYSKTTQTIVFEQIDDTGVRGRFAFGGVLSHLVDEPLKDYMSDFDFVTVSGSEYTFTLRKSAGMRSFFDTTLTGKTLTELFPFEDLLVRPGEIAFVGSGTGST